MTLFQSPTPSKATLLAVLAVLAVLAFLLSAVVVFTKLFTMRETFQARVGISPIVDDIRRIMKHGGRIRDAASMHCRDGPASIRTGTVGTYPFVSKEDQGVLVVRCDSDDDRVGYVFRLKDGSFRGYAAGDRLAALDSS